MEYVSHLPLSYIYYSAGRRQRVWPARVGRAPLLVVLHAHVVAPALCVLIVGVLRDGLDHRVVKGAIFSSIGGPCSWLSLALSESGNAPLVAASYVSSLVAVPVSMFILCGRATLPPLGSVISSTLLAALPFLAGYMRRPDATSRDTTYTKCLALSLLYVECCAGMSNVGGAGVGDVFTALVLGWMTSASCSPSGLGLLPAALMPVSHALALAAVDSCAGREHEPCPDCTTLPQ